MKFILCDNKNNRSFKVFIILIIIIFIYFSRSICKKLSFNNFQPMTNYKSSENFKTNLTDIFKNPEFNLNSYPNVDLKPGQNFLQNNKFLPECCFYYNDYSTDKGCPCITPEQQYYLQRRGLNRDKNSFLKESNDYTNLYFSPTFAFKN
tara:strand:- start:20 stop:466 length:447 start_codon:yes stop_codon:yes gene_type:complete